MNVFDAIKGTILNAPKDISTGIKALTKRDSVSEGSASDHGVTVNGGVSFDAGGSLLSKFQNSWSEIHEKSEDNAKLAKNVDNHVTELYIYLERQNDAVNQFLLEISALPELLTDLRAVTSKIENLESQFERVESELSELENVCEEQELRRNQKHHLYQLEMYGQRRNTELEHAKVHMARSHAAKVQRYEHHLQRSLRERQQAFEATYREEVQHYKKFGTTSPLFKQRIPPDVKPEVLDSFIPDEDTSTLNEFLAQDTDLVFPEDPLQTTDSTDSEIESGPLTGTDLVASHGTTLTDSEKQNTCTTEILNTDTPASSQPTENQLPPTDTIVAPSESLNGPDAAKVATEQNLTDAEEVSSAS